MTATVENQKIEDNQSESVKTPNTGTKVSSEDSVLTLRCSNRRMDPLRNNSDTLFTENADGESESKSFSRILVGTMKSALTSSAKKLRKKDKESRIDEEGHDKNIIHNEERDGCVHFKQPSDSFSFSVEDCMIDNSQTPAPTSENGSKTGSKSKKDKIKNLFKSKQAKKKIDNSIGIKLALPDKIDVMRGLEVPTRCKPSMLSDNDQKKNMDAFTSSQKKLMILPDKSLNAITRSISTMQSPFKNMTKIPKKKRHVSDPTHTRKNIKMEEVILRSSELDPSVHQTTIPTANEVLIHARVCALMEGNDQLLEARAKAGKKWFSFGDLVGIDRLELKNMYLSAIGQNPVIPMFVGQNTYQPPPLPSGNLPLHPNEFGNPFDVKYPNNLSSLQSFDNSSQSTSSPRKKKMNSTKPHPSIIKSLLECADDIVVEQYFNETIGEDSELEADSATSTSNVQVTIFSSQRQREFIVCFRGSMLQHAKPFPTKSSATADSNGVISAFSQVYNEAGLEGGIFKSLNELTTENPFCDICFCGHSFAGNLAAIAAVKCAESHPMLTIKCHTFGSPKMGLQSFQQRAHSLPNLRIFTIEFGSDYYVNQPNEACWTQVGHSIVISRINGSSSKTIMSPRKERVVAKAYKFGKNKTHQTRLKKYQMKADHDMRVYLHAIESFTHLGCPWMKSFEGEGGMGIVSQGDNEERLVV